MKNVQTTFHEGLPIALRSVNRSVFQLKNEETRRRSSKTAEEREEEEGDEDSEGYFDVDN